MQWKSQTASRQMRTEHCHIPILMLTSGSSLMDRVRGLNAGADYCLSKETILLRVWGYDSNAVENHAEVYVGLLRKKLHEIGSDIRIKAIRHLGYHLEI